MLWKQSLVQLQHGKVQLGHACVFTRVAMNYLIKPCYQCDVAVTATPLA